MIDKVRALRAGRCLDANGVYGSVSRWSFCSYADLYGQKWSDYYINGRYKKTIPA